MSNLRKDPLVKLLLWMGCFMLAHSRNTPVCQPTCTENEECRVSPDGDHRCYDRLPTDYNDPAICLPKLNNHQVEECLLGPLDGCYAAEFGVMYSTNVTVVNPDVCTVTEHALESYNTTVCTDVCNSVNCLYYWFDGFSYDVCKIFGNDCVIRASLGFTPYTITYRVCARNNDSDVSCPE